MYTLIRLKHHLPLPDLNLGRHVRNLERLPMVETSRLFVLESEIVVEKEMYEHHFDDQGGVSLAGTVMMREICSY